MKKIIMMLSIMMIALSCNHIHTKKELLAIKEADSIASIKADSIRKHDSLWKNEYDKKAEKENEIAEKKWNSSKAGRIYAKHSDWSKEDCQLIADKKIWIGMHIDMVVYMRGRPNKINTSNYGNGNEYQYVWEDYDIGYFYCKENGIVSSYN